MRMFNDSMYPLTLARPLNWYQSYRLQAKRLYSQNTDLVPPLHDLVPLIYQNIDLVPLHFHNTILVVLHSPPMSLTGERLNPPGRPVSYVQPTPTTHRLTTILNAPRRLRFSFNPAVASLQPSQFVPNLKIRNCQTY
jgi:hypothetical protein